MINIEKYVDDIVIAVDYDIWKDAYNEETAEEPEFVADTRAEIKFFLLKLINEVKNEGS